MRYTPNGDGPARIRSRLHLRRLPADPAVRRAAAARSGQRRSVRALQRAPDAQAAAGVGQHGHGDTRRDADAIRLMEQTGVGTLTVVDGANRLVGLLTERDVRFVPQDSLVSERMT